MLSSIKLTRMPSLSHPWRQVHFREPLAKLTVHAVIYQADQDAFPESPLKASPFSWTPSTILLTVYAVIYQADQDDFPESPLKASPFS